MKHTCFKRNIFLEGWAGFRSLCVIIWCHGDRPQGPPRLQWDACSTIRHPCCPCGQEPRASYTWVGPPWRRICACGRSTSGASSGSGKGAGKALIEPWTCGHRCCFWEQACTRSEGHSHHSCWNCRHKTQWGNVGKRSMLTTFHQGRFIASHQVSWWGIVLILCWMWMQILVLKISVSNYA